MKQIRLARLRSHYRAIAKLEVKIGGPAIELRVDFSNDTINIINRSAITHGIGRGQRRAWKRRIVASPHSPR